MSCTSALCKPFHHLLNVFLKYGVIPSQWHIHKIIPVYKSGDSSSIRNYHPISLLSITSKVLEHLIFGKLLIQYHMINCYNYKLWINGITGFLWAWFNSYLNNRFQRISINNQLSAILPVKSGIPQGIILEPLLFLSILMIWFQL